MKGFIVGLLAASVALSFGQGHDLKPADALKNLNFLKGNWKGKQEFVTGGAPMSGDATNRIDDAIGGHYIAEMLSTTLPGRAPTDTRHFISYDAKDGHYHAWWFTDTSVGPMEFDGTLSGHTLTLVSKPIGPASNVMRAIYDSPKEGMLVYSLALKDGDNWRPLFRTTYELQKS